MNKRIFNILYYITLIFFVVAISWLLGKSLSNFFVESENSQFVSDNVNQDNQGNTLQSPKLSSLFSMVKAPIKPNNNIIKKSRSGAKLTGIVISTLKNNSLVVIDYKGNQDAYGVNETVKGSRIKVTDIYPDKIYISNNGVKEYIDFESRNNASNIPKSTKILKKNDQLQKIASMDRTKIKPSTILQYIRMSQVIRDGKLVGYRLRPGVKKDFFYSVGLRDNDLAISLNGFDLTEPIVMTKLREELLNASSFNVTVQRDGQLHDIFVEL
ncbi:type II secretion system protein GspC [Paraphotobacterium marinum]|uniref:Type II secretion system protein GspC n=1 Tax=Paraphotobacterium marinum TaxID=1755811 RepID=A0A220VDE7_9GAMM|nr:type II secretion system protein GspC [Paraphotobacterium marinum]ASK78192.1 type II secretion system protein GspC [Paraphotobacterium marinum]